MSRSSARSHSADICQSAHLPACCATKGSVAGSRRGTGGRGECLRGSDQAKPYREENGRWRTPSVVSGSSHCSMALCNVISSENKPDLFNLFNLFNIKDSRPLFHSFSLPK